MGNTYAWPVVRTIHLGEALGLAERLLTVASSYDPADCHLHASASTDDDLRRLTETFPGAQVESRGRGGVGLPVSFFQFVRTFEQVRETLGSWAAVTRCYVLWPDLTWPSVPELRLGEERGFEPVQLLRINA